MTPNARDKPVGRSHSRSRQLLLRHHNPGSLVQIMWRTVIRTFEHTNGMHALLPLLITNTERLQRTPLKEREVLSATDAVWLSSEKTETGRNRKERWTSKGTAMHRSWMIADRRGQRKPHRCIGP